MRGGKKKNIVCKREGGCQSRTERGPFTPIHPNENSPKGRAREATVVGGRKGDFSPFKGKGTKRGDKKKKVKRKNSSIVTAEKKTA